MSCVICQMKMAVHDYADHVRVFHPEDEQELLAILSMQQPSLAVA